MISCKQQACVKVALTGLGVGGHVYAPVSIAVMSFCTQARATQNNRHRNNRRRTRKQKYQINENNTNLATKK